MLHMLHMLRMVRQNNLMKNQKKIFTIPEAADYCAVTRMTMWRWVKSGKISASVTPGGHHKILAEDLEAFFRENDMHLFADKHFSSHRILIVDDDPLIQKSLTKLFSQHDYETQTASDGFEAGANAVLFKPDIIILDLIMPRMDGFEVCKFLKRNIETSHIKICVLTGYDSKENKKAIMKAGADAFLLKPVDNDNLLNKIEELLNSQTSYQKETLPLKID